MQLVRETHVKATADCSPQVSSHLMLMVTCDREVGQVGLLSQFTHLTLPLREGEWGQ